MFSSSSSLSLTWNFGARPLNVFALDEHMIRIITECFGVERETIQFSRREVDLSSTEDNNNNNSNHQKLSSASFPIQGGGEVSDDELFFTFPGGFLHLTLLHLTVRTTNHLMSSGATCSPLTSSFLTQVCQLLSFVEEDQLRCSISDVVSKLVYVAFGCLDNEMYLYLSSAFMDGQWFANTVLPRSLTLNRPLTVSGFVSVGFPDSLPTVASPVGLPCLSLSEVLLFLPVTLLECDAIRVSQLMPTTDVELHAVVAPSLPFNSEPGQLVCQRTRSAQSMRFVEGSFPCDASGDRFMRLSATSFTKHPGVGSLGQTVLQNYTQPGAKVPECVIVEVVVGGVDTTYTNPPVPDQMPLKHVLLQGTGYQISLRHQRQEEAAAAVVTSSAIGSVPVECATPTSSLLKKQPVNLRLAPTTVPRTASKQALANLLNQLQNKRTRTMVSSTSTTIPEVTVIHVAKSAEAVPVLGLPSAYQEEADVLRRYVYHFRPDRAVMLVNIQKVVEQWQRWRLNLPRVQPYYAVKCNPDLVLLQTLANLGCNFDCASQGEIDVILKSLQLTPDRIVYSNPCKQEYGVRHAKQRKVKLTVFDNVDELIKIARIYPDCELLLRLSTDDQGSQCPLSCKFGANSAAWTTLLDKAKELKLIVRGVHFHVGSGCSQLGVFTHALQDARRVFDLGLERGFQMEILNLGGGFPGVIKEHDSLVKPTVSASGPSVVTFEDLCDEINPLVNRLFPVSGGYRVIAEPGRYFAAASACLAVKIYSRRKPVEHTTGEEGEEGAQATAASFLYYINDGVYGSFNNLIFDHANISPRILIQARQQHRQGRLYGSTDGSDGSSLPVMRNSTIFGQTCDGFDCVKRRIDLPQLEIGDWLLFEAMGAYTICAASTFNGFELPTKLHVRIMPQTQHATTTSNNPLCRSVLNLSQSVAVSSRCGVSAFPASLSPPTIANSTSLVDEDSHRLSLSPCMAGYQLYQQQQQLLQLYNSSPDAPYSRALPPLMPSVSPSAVLESVASAEFPLFDPHHLLGAPSPSESQPALESVLLEDLTLPQRPRLSFRPLSVRPLQSTAQQHTSYPRLGGGKVYPRLVASLLRSAYCKHRLAAPTLAGLTTSATRSSSRGSDPDHRSQIMETSGWTHSSQPASAMANDTLVDAVSASLSLSVPTAC